MRRPAWARRCAGGLLEAAVLVLLLGCAAADDLRLNIPDTYVGRLEALALLETLNAELLSHDSATLTLEHWCDEHRLAAPARVVAARVAVPDKPPSPEQRRELNVSDSEPVRYRRVRLSCGAAVLSEADNWYVPGRLTADMNEQLENTDTPFGKVLQPLHFKRHTLSADLLWRPLPRGWEMEALRMEELRMEAPRERAPRIGTPTAKAPLAIAPLAIPSEILQHRALLTLPDGTPVSEVIETYSGAVLSFTVQSSPD